MPVPKKRTSKSVKGMRRSHDGLKPNKAIMICDTCGAPKLMHHVCAACGTYRSHQVLPATDEAQA